MGSVDIHLTTSNVPEGYNYHCHYYFLTSRPENETVISADILALRNHDMFECALSFNVVPDLPKMQGVLDCFCDVA